jgi:iron complex transport system substrate-binding protein
MTDRYPQRIVCLTEEPTEVLYALGEQHRIVGISGFTVRPAQARKEKPRVSAFTSARIERILALKPDFVVGFSDLQADIAQALIRQGIEVWISNHRSIEGILGYIRRLGALVGSPEKADLYIGRIEQQLAVVREQARRLTRRPRVYFEEWDEPMISGIGWVSQLLELAGGTEIFPERARSALASGRIIASGEEVIAASPDIIFGSWCGKRFRPDQVAARAGWSAIPAVRTGQLHEIKSPIILQPGPAALTEGVERMQRVILEWARQHQALH